MCAEYILTLAIIAAVSVYVSARNSLDLPNCVSSIRTEEFARHFAHGRSRIPPGFQIAYQSSLDLDPQSGCRDFHQASWLAGEWF